MSPFCYESFQIHTCESILQIEHIHVLIIRVFVALSENLKDGRVCKRKRNQTASNYTLRADCYQPIICRRAISKKAPRKA